MAKRGQKLTEAKVAEVREAIARGLKRKDVVRICGISYTTYNKYASEPAKANRKTVTDRNKVVEVAGAVKLIVEVAEAFSLITKELANAKVENEVLSKALQFARDEVKILREKENQRISLKIEAENAVQSQESRD